MCPNSQNTVLGELYSPFITNPNEQHWQYYSFAVLISIVRQALNPKPYSNLKPPEPPKAKTVWVFGASRRGITEIRAQVRNGTFQYRSPRPDP